MSLKTIWEDIKYFLNGIARKIDRAEKESSAEDKRVDTLAQKIIQLEQANDALRAKIEELGGGNGLP